MSIQIIKLLMLLASNLAQYARDRKLMDAGAAEAVVKGLRDADDAIRRANIARADVERLPVNADKNNRDNR